MTKGWRKREKMEGRRRTEGSRSMKKLFPERENSEWFKVWSIDALQLIYSFWGIKLPNPPILH